MTIAPCVASLNISARLLSTERLGDGRRLVQPFSLQKLVDAISSLLPRPLGVPWRLRSDGTW